MSGFEEEFPFPLPFVGLRGVGIAPLPPVQPFPTASSGYWPGARDAVNVSFTADGGMYCRLGFAPFDGFTQTVDATDDPAGLHDFRLRDAATRHIVVASRAKLWSRPGTYPGLGAWTTLKSGLTGDLYNQFVTFRNQCVSLNGKDTPQVWDGTATTTSNLVQKIWSTSTALPTAQSAGSCWVIRGDPEERVHLACGKVGSATSFSGLHQEYFPALQAWTTLPAGPPQDQNDGEALIAAGFVFGGALSATTHTAVGQKWDDALRVWSPTASMVAAKHKQACFVAGTPDQLSVYECGGSTDVPASTTQSATCNRYDDILNAWTSRAALNTARRGLSAFELVGGGISVGGMTGAGPTYSAVTEYYDPNLNTWVAKASLNTARAQLGSAPGWNTFGYAVGGTSGSDLTTVEEYDGSANTWTALTGSGALTAARNEMRCALSGKYLFAAGGQSSGTPQTTNYRLNTSPQPPTCRFVAVYRDRLVMWGDPNAPSTLSVGDIGELDSWDPRFKMLFDQDDGDWATAVFTWRDNLYVMKRDGGWLVTWRRFHPDPAKGDQTKRPLTLKGPVNQQSVVITDDAVFWCGEDGFYRFDGLTAVNISRHARLDHASWMGIDPATGANNGGPSGVWDERTREVRWYAGRTGALGSLAGSQTGYFCAVVNVDTGGWSTHVLPTTLKIAGRTGPVAASIEWGNDLPDVWFIAKKTSTVLELYRADFSQQDQGGGAVSPSGIPATWRTTPFSPGGNVEQSEIVRFVMESTGPLVSPLATFVPDAPDQGGRLHALTVPTGAGKTIQRYDNDRINSVGWAHELYLYWSNPANSMPILKNAQLTYHRKGGGRK